MAARLFACLAALAAVASAEDCLLVGQYVVPYGDSAALSLLEDLNVQTVDEVDVDACYEWYFGLEQTGGGSDVSSFTEPGILRVTASGVDLGDPSAAADNGGSLSNGGDDYASEWASHPLSSIDFSSFSGDYYGSVYAVPAGLPLPLYETKAEFMTVTYWPNGNTPSADFTLTVADVAADRANDEACRVYYADMGTFMSGGKSDDYSPQSSETCLEVVVAPYHEAAKRVQWAAVTLVNTNTGATAGVRYDSDGSVYDATVFDTVAKGSLVWVSFSDNTADVFVSVDCPANNLVYTDLDFTVDPGECAYVSAAATSAYDVVRFQGSATGGVEHVLAVDGYATTWGDVFYRGSDSDFVATGSDLYAEAYFVAGLGGAVTVSGEVTTPMNDCGDTDADGCGYCIVDSASFTLDEWDADNCQAYRVLAGPMSYSKRITFSFSVELPADGSYVVGRETGSGTVLSEYGADQSGRASFWMTDLTQGLDVVMHGGAAGASDNSLRVDIFSDYSGNCVQQHSATGDGASVDLAADFNPKVDFCAAVAMLVECASGRTIQTVLDGVHVWGDAVLSVYEGQTSTQLAWDGSPSAELQSSTEAVWVEVTSDSFFSGGGFNGTLTFRESVDCELSEWEIVGACDSTGCGLCDLTTRALCRSACAAGQQRQNRTIITDAAFNGAACGELTQLVGCEDSGCAGCPHVIVIYFRSPEAAPYLTYDLGDSAVYASVPMDASGNGRYPAADGWYSVAVGGDEISFVFESSEGTILSEYYALGAGDSVFESGVLAAFAPAHDHFVL